MRKLLATAFRRNDRLGTLHWPASCPTGSTGFAAAQAIDPTAQIMWAERSSQPARLERLVDRQPAERVDFLK
jgi:hypothetical protein